MKFSLQTLLIYFFAGAQDSNSSFNVSWGELVTEGERRGNMGRELTRKITEGCGLQEPCVIIKT